MQPLMALSDDALMKATRGSFSGFVPQQGPQNALWLAVLDQLFLEFLEASDVRALYDSSADFLAGERWFAADLSQWRGEVLVIRAADDPALAPVAPERLEARFRSPSLHVFDTGGHMLSVTRAPQYRAVVEAFLEG